MEQVQRPNGGVQMFRVAQQKERAMVKHSTFEDKVEAAFRYTEGKPVVLKLCGKLETFHSRAELLARKRRGVEHAIDEFNCTIRLVQPEPRLSRAGGWLVS